jgi:hypothetical protein
MVQVDPTTVARPLRSTGITPASSLLRGRSAPARRIGIFGLTVVAACAFSLRIAEQVLTFHVRETLVLMPRNPVSTVRQRFTCVRLSHPHMTQSPPRLFHDVSPPRLLSEGAHGCLEPPPPKRLRRALLHLSHSMTLPRLRDTTPTSDILRHRSERSKRADFVAKVAARKL